MSPAARAAAWTIELAARGPVPDVLLRAAIRRRLRDTVAEARATGAATAAGRAAFHARLECDDDATGVSRRGAPEEPPASFFVPWLGPRMKYSSALWSAGAPDLAAAEEAMLAARGPVPDVLLRAAIRRRLRDTVAEARASGAATAAGRSAFHARLECDDDAAGVSRPAAPEEPPASFFVPWLGPRMKYSSALWSAGAPDLAAAEEAMLALTCERAGLADGHAILDLGCGWGAFALYVAERYPRARVTAVTDSLEQARFVARAAAAAAARGLNAPRVVVGDLRRLELSARFDRVVALEALEYARNWPALFARVRRWLAPDGLLFAEVLSCRDWGTTWGPGEPGAWLGRGILAGAMMPDDDLLAACGRDLVEERRWVVPGLDLARTVEAWRERLDHAARTSPAHRGRLARRWRLLLLVLGAMFAHDEGRLWRALHVVARPRATPGA